MRANISRAVRYMLFVFTSRRVEMNEKEVVELMKTSKTESEWNDNCDKVKKACGGYPSFWYPAVVMSGVMAETATKFAK